MRTSNKQSDEQYNWGSGAKLAYSAWMGQILENENCVTAFYERRLQWYPTSCKEEQAYVCQKRKTG